MIVLWVGAAVVAAAAGVVYRAQARAERVLADRGDGDVF